MANIKPIQSPSVVGSIDTHKNLHVAAVVDQKSANIEVLEVTAPDKMERLKYDRCRKRCPRCILQNTYRHAKNT